MLAKSEYLKFAIQLAKESAKILEKMHKKAKIVTHKDRGDFALDADVASEQHILKRIKEKYPSHSVLTEETGKHDKHSDYMWVIDPLDGTLNYAHYLPFYGVNIALYHKGKPLLGVIYCPPTKELFYAEKGKGAYLNGKRIHVNDDVKLMGSFFTGNIKHYCDLSISRHLIRYLGCSGLELAFVACGRFGARLKTRGKDLFGYAAGTILVTEAGGKVTDIKGKPWDLHSEGALASNGKIHGKILKVVRKQL